jgi:hypothetical protein
LLFREPSLSDLIVTGVTAEPVSCRAAASGYSRRVTRYLLTLANYQEPISLIGKRTNTAESQIYRVLASRLNGLLPPHWYVYDGNEPEISDVEEGFPSGGLKAEIPQDLRHAAWLLMADVPDDYSPERWTQQDVEDIIGDLADLHAAFWDDGSPAGERNAAGLSALEHFIGDDGDRYTWEQLRRAEAIYFDEGPGALFSDHALKHAGRLAPRFLRAANGLVVMRALDGWPGVLGESHLSAVADLLDDPVPMLRPLLEIPETLLHGAPHPYHWRLSLFGERRLIDWREATWGPGLLDLVYFLEQFPLLYNGPVGENPLDASGRAAFPHLSSHARNHQRWGERGIYVRGSEPADEETIIDSYILAMSMRLGNRFPARLVRQAIPAARCLHVLSQWFPLFATWFSDMPNKYTWQRANRMSDAELSSTFLWPIVGYRRYLAGVFTRFLQAYRSL